MADVVLDASALLARILGEVGADRVEPFIDGAHVSAVNLAEVASKLVDNDFDDFVIPKILEKMDCLIDTFDDAAAIRAGLLRRQTRSQGLSLGDRACLELAVRLGLPVLTADRAWAELDLGVEVVLIR